ncbi:MAG: AraC family transcriptional regulator [Chloroflexota bacterium]
MTIYELTSDEAFFETMSAYSTGGNDTMGFGDESWRFNMPSCRGMISNRSLSPGVAMTLFDIETLHAISFRMNSVMPRMLELGFVTAGEVEIDVHGRRREFDSLAGQNYAALFEGEMQVKTNVPAGQRIQLVEIRFSPTALERWCQHLDQSLPYAFQKTLAEKTISPSKHTSIMTHDMNQLASDILANPQGHAADSLYLESKCLELTSLYLAVASQRGRSLSAGLSPRDIERIREARYILQTRMDDPPSLIELARLVNLNDFKLKQGFRQAFGTTAFGYLKEYRLQRAHELLREEKMSVTDTAISVGYRNIGDFGIAFKRRFGMSPKKVRLG